RHRRRNARRLPTSEPLRPRDLRAPPSADPRRVARPRELPPRGVGGIVYDWLRRVDCLQGHEDDLALLGAPDERLRHRAARFLSASVCSLLVAVALPAPAETR